MHPENTKPAATVHGTGSGEPKLADQRCCGCGKRYQEHAGRDNLCYTDGRTLTFMPTPPASPTVTLDRETYDDLVMMLEKLAHSEQVINGMKIITHGLGARAIALDALARLRAAERQQ